MNDQCPKQGMYFRIFLVLNRVRVSNPQQSAPAYTQMLVEYPPPPGKALLSITQIALSLSLTLTRGLGGNRLLHLRAAPRNYQLDEEIVKK